MNHCLCYLEGAREIWLVRKILISEHDGCLRLEGGEGGRTGDGDLKAAPLCPPTGGERRVVVRSFESGPRNLAPRRREGEPNSLSRDSCRLGRERNEKAGGDIHCPDPGPAISERERVALWQARSRWVMSSSAEPAGTLATTPKF